MKRCRSVVVIFGTLLLTSFWLLVLVSSSSFDDDDEELVASSVSSRHAVVEYTNDDGSSSIFHEDDDNHSTTAAHATIDDSDRHDHHEGHGGGGGCRFHRLSKQDELADEARMATWRMKRYNNNNNNDAATNLFLRAGKSSSQQQQQSQQRQQSHYYTIPVHVHIIQANFFWGYQSDDDIASAMSYLNEAFKNADAPFVFQHMTTTRTMNRQWGDNCGDPNTELQFKRSLKKGGADTLNLYMCHTITDERGGILNGYAYAPFPSSDSFPKDGVVVAGRGKAQYNTIVHEVGHYLGLFHTFGTSCQEKDGTGGDYVNDTPIHTNRFAHSIVNCQVSKVIPWDSCPNSNGKDPLDNYMAYVKNSECRSKFTKGQVERMVGQYELYRWDDKSGQKKIPTPSKCLPFLATCKVDADCCDRNRCVFFSFSNRRLCWM